ncbi:MAG: hypothetical protein EHM39_05155 [Chloroflexi bacterium]|nr:MAG: hypothetical protein EHM39_05155 [Chloroflexota bacterium]
MAQIRRGNGWVVLDEVAWESESRNATKANRFASSLLAGLGAALRLPQALRIEAETMTNINVTAYNVSGGSAWLYSNGRIETAARFTKTGAYAFEVMAAGTTAAGVLPQVAILIDGVTRTNWFLTTTQMTRYVLNLSIAAGTRRIALAFLNDANPAPEDRNAAFDRLVIMPPSPPRITWIHGDTARHLATIQWETTPGKSYEVQLTDELNGPTPWLPLIALTSPGTAASWQDTGALSGAPPFSPAAPRRFYRVSQRSP